MEVIHQTDGLAGIDRLAVLAKGKVLQDLRVMSLGKLWRSQARAVGRRGYLFPGLFCWLLYPPCHPQRPQIHFMRCLWRPSPGFGALPGSGVNQLRSCPSPAAAGPRTQQLGGFRGLVVSFGADQIASQHHELPSTMVVENHFVLGLSRFVAGKGRSLVASPWSRG